MLASLQGKANHKQGTDFENLFAESCRAYLNEGMAYINKMPMPTRPINMGGRLYYVSCGKPEYDFYGHTLAGAVAIGVECKSSSELKTAMSIIAPEHEGTGLQYHQLEGLANLARAGGIAKVLWDNGGKYCMLEEPAIVQAHMVYVEQYKAGLAQRPAPRGSKSIPFSLFRPLDIRAVAGKVVLDWLTLPTPTPQSPSAP